MTLSGRWRLRAGAWVLASVALAAPVSGGYHASTVELAEPLAQVGPMAASDGLLWLDLEPGVLTRIDPAGPVRRVALPACGGGVRNLWPVEGGVVVDAAGGLWRVSSAGEVVWLATTGTMLRAAVPVADGYVGLSRAGELFHVAASGERTRLVVPRIEPAAEQEEAPGQGGESGETGSPPAAQEVVTSLPADALLVPGESDRVLVVAEAPLRFWHVGLDGSYFGVEVDDSAVAAPAGPRWDWARVTGIARPTLGRVALRGGRLYVERRYRTDLETIAAHEGMEPGSPLMTFSVVIDIVEPTSGRVVERLDLFAQEAHGWWAGFRGEADLVLVDPGPVTRLVVLASE